MQRRILAVAVLATVAIGTPVVVADAATKLRGAIFGAVTSQGYPVVVELNKTATKVVRATIGLEVRCGMPPDITLPDEVVNLKIDKKGRFSATTPTTRLPADPSTGQPPIDVSASVTGTLNKAKTSIKGTWQRKVVIYDASDPTGTAIFDTCDTGVLGFRARQ